MSNLPIELSLEQQFDIQSFRNQVERMSREQAQDFLMKLYEQNIYLKITYNQLLKAQWGIETPPIS